MKIYTELVGSYPPIMELPVTANEAYVKGEVLTIASGKATKAGVDSDGTRLYVCEETMAANAKTTVKAHMILNHLFYEAICADALTSNAIHTVVTLDSAATGITTTATKGVATIISKPDGASGKRAIIQFR